MLSLRRLHSPYLRAKFLRMNAPAAFACSAPARATSTSGGSAKPAFDPITQGARKRMGGKAPKDAADGHDASLEARLASMPSSERVPKADRLLRQLFSKSNMRKHLTRMLVVLFLTMAGIYVADKQLGLVSDEEKGLRRHFAQANRHMQQHEYEQAIREYNAALGYYMDATVFYNRALAFLEMDNVTQALFDCDTAISLDPKYEAALVRRAVIKHGTGDLKGAIDDLLRALDLITLRESGEGDVAGVPAAAVTQQPQVEENAPPQGYQVSIETMGVFARKMLGTDKIVMNVRGANQDEVKELARRYVDELKTKADADLALPTRQQQMDSGTSKSL